MGKRGNVLRCAYLGCMKNTARPTRFGPVNNVSDRLRQYCWRQLKPALRNGVLCSAHCKELRQLADEQSAAEIAAAAVLLSDMQQAVLVANHIVESVSSSSLQPSPLSSQHAPQSSPAAFATSSTAPLLAATPITVGGTTASVTCSDAVLQPLYDDSMPHPGLLHGAVPLTEQPQPPHLEKLGHTRAAIYSMPAVCFNVPDENRVERASRKRCRVKADVLENMRELAKRMARPRRVLYQRDNESFSAWPPAQPSIPAALDSLHAYNPHLFALHHANLSSLMLDAPFAGFSSPSWYVKQRNSFFCMHVEQLFAPFYNYCYSGGTTWWVVRREDRARLDAYLVERAKAEYGVTGALSAEQEAAVKGLLFTKLVYLHRDDLLKAGVRLSEVQQVGGTVVIGDGDLVHFGRCTLGENANSTNEAVNFLPIQWLSTGLPRLLDWMRWLRDSWLPMQKHSAMRCPSEQNLRAAMQNSRTNELLALHCAPLWTHVLLMRLQDLLELDARPAPGSSGAKTRQAVYAQLTDDGVAKAQENIAAVLDVMDGKEVKEWLLKHSAVDGIVPTEYLKHKP